MPEAVEVSTAKRQPRSLMLAILCVLAVYFWIGMGAGLAPVYQMLDYHYYDLLADGFLAGQLSLTVEPRPELLQLADPYDPDQNQPYRLHDLSLYNGKYYLFSGPLPALVAFVPFKWATGVDLPQYLAVILFCSASFLISTMILRKFIAEQAPACPLWLQVVAILLVGFCSGNLHLLRWPSVYQTANACAVAFFLLSLLGFLHVFTGTRARHLIFCLSSTVLALCIAARPHFLPAIVLVTMGTGAWLGWNSTPPGMSRRKHTIKWAELSLLPVLAVALGMATYNAMRFGDPLESGLHYQLASVKLRSVQSWHLDYAWKNLCYYLGQLPTFSTQFPYLQGLSYGHFIRNGNDFYLQERLFGLAGGIPVCLGVLVLPLASRPLSGGWRTFFTAVSILGGMNLILLLFFNSASVRYFSDFLPALALLAAAGWIAGRRAIPASDRFAQALFAIVVIALTLYSSWLAIAVNVPLFK